MQWRQTVPDRLRARVRRYSIAALVICVAGFSLALNPSGSWAAMHTAMGMIVVGISVAAFGQRGIRRRR